jgi:DNA-binding MarR family transcriptional regulator
MSGTDVQLPDGTRLTSARQRDGHPCGVDSETHRTVAYLGDDTGGRLVDADGQTVREITPGAQRATAAAGKPASPSRARPDRRRWLTLNTFVDSVARHLEPHEVAVWLVVFRWTQDDTAEIRLADIAGRIGKSTRTVKRAVDRLVDVGLLERLRRGTRQGGPSRYRLEPEPASAIPKLAPAAAPQHDARVTLKRTPKHQRRNRRGAFTT